MLVRYVYWSNTFREPRSFTKTISIRDNLDIHYLEGLCKSNYYSKYYKKPAPIPMSQSTRPTPTTDLPGELLNIIFMPE